MSLGTEVDLGPGHTVLDAAQLNPPPERGTAAPSLFGPCLLWLNGRPSQLLLSYCYKFTAKSLGERVLDTGQHRVKLW